MSYSQDHSFRRGETNLPYNPSISPQQIELLRIHTPRLILRPVRAEDASNVFTEFTKHVAEHMTPEPANNLEDTVEFLQGAIEARKTGTDLQLVIMDPTEQEFLGLIGLHTRYGRQTPEIGIWLKADAWGRGLGKAAVHSLIEWANQNMQFEYIVYPVSETNYPSRNIAESYKVTPVRSFTTTRSWAGPLTLVEYHILYGSLPGN